MVVVDDRSTSAVVAKTAPTDDEEGVADLRGWMVGRLGHLVRTPLSIVAATAHPDGGWGRDCASCHGVGGGGTR